MIGSRPQKLPAPSPQSTGGRICAAPGCRTRLSIYNSDIACWQHADLVFPNYRGKRVGQAKEMKSPFPT